MLVFLLEDNMLLITCYFLPPVFLLHLIYENIKEEEIRMFPG